MILAFAIPALAQAQTPSPGTPPPPPAIYAPPAGAPAPPLPPPTYVESPAPHRSFSLTISPLHLISPILELTGEIRAADKLGIAVVAGAGKFSDTINGIKISATALEAGAQFRYYVLGDFHSGMQLGAELLYLHLSDTNLSATGQGVAIGPFVGYKYTADVGFTFDGQFGVERLITDAPSSSTASTKRWFPLLNVNVGWSF
ncbi:MAG TPA: hypothetical protein VFH73_27980 [Polyangia bacterium]|nr:hypothetical protein [Polyangia bacterium]